MSTHTPDVLYNRVWIDHDQSLLLGEFVPAGFSTESRYGGIALKKKLWQDPESWSNSGGELSGYRPFRFGQQFGPPNTGTAL
jgi:hypothetical protein